MQLSSIQTLFTTPISRVQQDLSYDSLCEPKIIVHQANQLIWLCLEIFKSTSFECFTRPWSILPWTIDSWCSPGDHSNAAVEDLCLPKGAVLFVFLEHVSVPKHLWAWLNSFIMLPSCQLVRWERLECSFYLVRLSWLFSSSFIIFVIVFVHCHQQLWKASLTSSTSKWGCIRGVISLGVLYRRHTDSLYLLFFMCHVSFETVPTVRWHTLRNGQDQSPVGQCSSRPFRQIWS